MSQLHSSILLSFPCPLPCSLEPSSSNANEASHVKQFRNSCDISKDFLGCKIPLKQFYTWTQWFNVLSQTSNLFKD
jgi:hypothetical protein